MAAEHGQQVSCDQSTVSRWLSGTTPRPPMPALLLEVLSRRLQRPVTAGEAGLSRAPAHGSDVFDLSWEADPLRRLSMLTGADLDPSRRHLLGAGLFSLAALAVPDAWPTPEKSPAGPPPRTAGARGRAGGAEVAQMQTMARMFAEAAEAHGPGHVRTALAAYLHHDVTGYLHAPAGEEAHRRLLSGAAQLSLLLGTMCAGSGADALAQRYHHTAAHLATEAGDAATFAIVLRTMSAHAHDLGHHTPAVLNLAQRAADATRHAAPIIRAYTQAHLAVMQAHHDTHAALTALVASERLYEQERAAPGPFTHYPAGALHYQRAQTLAALGDRTGATGALTASLRLRTSAERQARTLTRARLAESLLGQGHLDAALTHWQAFLDDYPTLHSTRVTRRLEDMRRRLHPHRRHRDTAQLLAQAAALL
ncbi:hypothetical protein AB0J38_13430 [Streptomyces sp. NPDC050095]|uniref:tetratricopeptide repeat protein n=1 Tax=unclassified Streptomyces TaxID=2593676 RepID=UPI00343941DB